MPIKKTIWYMVHVHCDGGEVGTQKYCSLALQLWTRKSGWECVFNQPKSGMVYQVDEIERV